MLFNSRQDGSTLNPDRAAGRWAPHRFNGKQRLFSGLIQPFDQPPCLGDINRLNLKENPMLKPIISVVAASWLFISGPLLAQNLYLDGALGNANVQEDDSDLEGDGTYFRVGIGNRYSEAVAFEGGYWDLGEAEDGIFSASADGLYFAVKGISKTSETMHLFARVGIYMWDATRCAGGFGCVDDDGSDPFFGGGVGFDAGQGTFNVELHLFELGDYDVQTIGASYTLPLGN